MNKNVIYTYVFNDYDTLKEPLIVSDNWDYVCFTNNMDLKSKIWVIYYIDFIDKSLSAKEKSVHLKINHNLFIGIYDLYISIDASFQIRVNLNDFIDEIKFKESNNDFYIFGHPTNCVYEEGRTIKRLKRDSNQNIDAHIKLLREVGYPEQYGLYSTGFIIRKHGNSNGELFLTKWLELYKNMPSIRDQMTFNVALWYMMKENINIRLSTNNLKKYLSYISDRKNNYFLLYNHKTIIK